MTFALFTSKRPWKKQVVTQRDDDSKSLVEKVVVSPNIPLKLIVEGHFLGGEILKSHHPFMVPCLPPPVGKKQI